MELTPRSTFIKQSLKVSVGSESVGECPVTAPERGLCLASADSANLKGTATGVANYMQQFRNKFTMEQFGIAGQNGTAKYSSASMFSGGGMAELGSLRSERFTFLYDAESNPALAKVWSAINAAKALADTTKTVIGEFKFWTLGASRESQKSRGIMRETRV